MNCLFHPLDEGDDRPSTTRYRVTLAILGPTKIITDGSPVSMDGDPIGSAVHATGVHSFEASGPVSYLEVWAATLGELSGADLDSVIDQLGVDTAAGTDTGKRKAITRHLEG